MIEEFSFGNFKSFKDIQTLNMAAAKIKSSVKELDENNIIQSDLPLLKSKAIYGANASGKSNVVKALITFLRIVKRSVQDDSVLNHVDSFQLSDETIDEPSFFQLIFRHEGIRYRYGFEADDQTIFSEWLFGTPNLREQPYFIRERQKIIEVNQTHFEEGNKLLELMGEQEENIIFRENSLFISTVSSFGLGHLSKKIVNAISSITVISGLGDKSMYSIAGSALKDEDMKLKIIGLLKDADFGINDLDTIELAKDNLPENVEEEIQSDTKNKKASKIIISIRDKYDKDNKRSDIQVFSFATQESEGTKKMFELSPFIFNTLERGTPLIVDELDARFHPNLTRKIVELFNSNKNSKSQLVFVTHDTNLLSADLLRRDQIDFVEKDKYGVSHLYSLVQFNGVRNNELFEKNYIRGKYGAIPFLGNFGKTFDFVEDA